ncbi:MAG TPA: hypothetical protein VKM54_19545 [Myxococcota bacterium]|nr:hypothetical protein [Myxococcota bacterium]
MVRGTLEARTAALPAPVSGSLEKLVVVTRSTSPRPRSRHAPRTGVLEGKELA